MGPSQAANSTGGPAAPLLPGMDSLSLWMHYSLSEQQLCISQGPMSEAALPPNLYIVTAMVHAP